MFEIDIHVMSTKAGPAAATLRIVNIAATASSAIVILENIFICYDRSFAISS